MAMSHWKCVFAFVCLFKGGGGCLGLILYVFFFFGAVVEHQKKKIMAGKQASKLIIESHKINNEIRTIINNK